MSALLFDTTPYVAPNISPARKLEIWRAYYEKCNAIAARIRKMKQERANRLWREAFGCDMPPHNCVHNWIMGAEDGHFTGKYAWTRLQLRLAKQVRELINDWDASCVAERATKKKWDRLHASEGRL